MHQNRKDQKKKDPLQWVLVEFFSCLHHWKLWTLQTQTIHCFHLAAFSGTFLHCPGSNGGIKGTGWVRELFTKPKWCASWCTMALCSYRIHRRKKNGRKTTTLGIRKSHGMMAWMIWNEKSEMSLQAICLNWTLLCLLTLQGDIQILVVFGTIFKNSKLDLWPKELTLPS